MMYIKKLNEMSNVSGDINNDNNKFRGDGICKPGETFKDVILRLLKKYNINYDKIKYYKISPYQKRRYKPEFWGEEVWIKYNGMNVRINSINDVDEYGDIEPIFINIFDCDYNEYLKLHPEYTSMVKF